VFTSHPAAALLAVEATRRRLHAPQSEPQAAGRRRLRRASALGTAPVVTGRLAGAR